MSWVAFDQALVEKPLEIEKIWATVSTVLTTAKNVADPPAKRSITMMLSTMEPGPKLSTGLDFLWLPDHAPPPEALLLTFDGEQPFKSTIRILFERQENQNVGQITLLLTTGTPSSPNVTITLTRGEGWSGEVTSAKQSVSIQAESATLAAEILIQSIWNSYSGPVYVGLPTKDRPHSDELERRARSPFSVQSNTAFLPKMSSEELDLTPN